MKILEYKLNAIMAKARAMYGSRLKAEDYAALVACRSMAEFVTYLKTRTDYEDDLSAVSASQPDARYIEFLIRKRAYNRFSTLCHYEMTLGEELSNYFIVNEEIRQLLFCIKSVLMGNREKYIISTPDFYEKSLHFDVKSLMSIRSVKELSDLLRGTPYKKIIDDGIRRNCSYLDYECSLVGYFNEYEHRLIEKNCKGKEKQQLLSLLSEKADTEFITRIYRLKKYFPESRAVMSAVAPTKLTRLTSKQIKSLVNARDEEDVIGILENTVYRSYAAAIRGGDFPEYAVRNLLYKKYKSLLRFGTSPQVTMFCFIFLTKNEVDNLVHIIEGIKYETGQENIRALLIGADD